MDGAQQFLTNTLAGGQLHLSSAQLVDFVSQVQQQQQQKPPASFIIERQQITGFARKDHVELVFQLSVSVFLETGWVIVPLLPESVTVSKVTINRAAEARLGLVHSSHALLLNAAGAFEVELSVLWPYASDKRCGLALTIPSASRTSLRFVVPQANISVNITPSVNTVSHSSDTETVSECNLPPTNSVNIQWTEKQRVETVEDLAPVPQKKEPIVVNATQHTLFSIGEGICASTVTWGVFVVWCACVRERGGSGGGSYDGDGVGRSRDSFPDGADE